MMNIYHIINDVDDKVYVGSTELTLERRYAYHLLSLDSGSERVLYRHMRQIGFNHFKPIIILHITTLANGLTLRQLEEMFRKLIPADKSLNMRRAYRTPQEAEEYYKQYNRRARLDIITCADCGKRIRRDRLHAHLLTTYHITHSSDSSE